MAVKHSVGGSGVHSSNKGLVVNGREWIIPKRFTWAPLERLFRGQSNHLTAVSLTNHAQFNMSEPPWLVKNLALELFALPEDGPGSVADAAPVNPSLAFNRRQHCIK